MPQAWNRKIVIGKILEMHRSGEKVNSNHVQLHHSTLYQAACRHIGSWKKAIRAAKLNYGQIRIKERQHPKWGKDGDAVLPAIQDLNRLGTPLNSNYAQLNQQKLYAAACKYFGGWREAVEAAGLDYETHRRVREFRSWSKKSIAQAIKDRHQQGLPIYEDAVYEDDRGLHSAARRYFGRRGWKKALRAAGFDPKKVSDPNRRIWTKDKVLNDIHILVESGSPIYGYYLCNNGHAKLFNGGCSAFGSWKKSVEAAGYDYKTVRVGRRYYWNQRRVIAVIRRLHKAGVRLSHNSVRAVHGDLIAAAITYFGSWSKAVYAAGIDYMKHCRIWSTKAWVAKLTKADMKRLEKTSTKMSERRRKGDNI